MKFNLKKSAKYIICTLLEYFSDGFTVVSVAYTLKTDPLIDETDFISIKNFVDLGFVYHGEKKDMTTPNAEKIMCLT